MDKRKWTEHSSLIFLTEKKLMNKPKQGVFCVSNKKEYYCFKGLTPILEKESELLGIFVELPDEWEEPAQTQ